MYIRSEVGAGAFFALSRSRARGEKRARKREEKRARKKRKRRARKKKSAKKAKAPSAKEKKREFALFAQPKSGNPVSEPKAAGQGEKLRS